MAQEGWICPRCGKVNAPWVQQCTCESKSMTVICGTNSNVAVTEMPKYETTCTCNKETMICS